MFVTNEIASITILVPSRKGSEIIHQIIPFKVFNQDEHYRAIPLISSAEVEVAGLSPELSFRFLENRIIPEADAKESDLHAINNIAKELRILRIV